MKKYLLKITTLSAIFAFGLGLVSQVNTNSSPVYAEQHADNYAAYTYTGNYYSSISSSATEGLNGTLRKTLGSLILPKAWYTYSGASVNCLGYELQQADQDPTNSSKMVLFYTRDSISKRSAGGSTTDWNREHVWPQSLSNGHWGKDKAGTDVLHIRPTWYTTNNSRGSIVYGDVNKTGPKTYDGMVYAYSNGSRFEPIDAVKGDVARILMYVWTAYYDYYNDTSLYLTKAIESYDTLLKWHTMDKPDALEGVRNNYAENSKQKNRNPFVDHPEYAWKIFGDSASQDVKNACKNAYPDGSPVDPPSSSSIESSDISSETITSESTSIESASQEQSIITSNPSSEESSVPPSDGQNKNRGCNGSVAGAISLLGMTSIVGLIFLFSKKKR